MKFGALVGGLVAVVWLAGCTSATDSMLAPGTLTGPHARTIYIPRFVGNPRWTSELTQLFINVVSDKAKVAVVRGDSVAQFGAEGQNDSAQPIGEPAFGAPMESNATSTDAGIMAARKVGAGLMVLGNVTTRPVAGGFLGVATVEIVMLSNGSTVSRLRKETTDADEHKAALGAVQQAAEAMAAGY